MDACTRIFFDILITGAKYRNALNILLTLKEILNSCNRKMFWAKIQFTTFKYIFDIFKTSFWSIRIEILDLRLTIIIERYPLFLYVWKVSPPPA